MTLLIDTDIFCKLALADLLNDGVRLLGVKLEDSARLPALPHMLQRGSLFNRLGAEACARLLPLAHSLRSVPEPTFTWIEKLTPIDAIDPGEARLFAAGAELGVMILCGDKRALRELKAVPGLHEALKGKVAVFEAILWALCASLGSDTVRQRLAAVLPSDVMLSICFSTSNSDPMGCLHSFYRSLAAEVDPLVLWNPNPEVLK